MASGVNVTDDCKHTYDKLHMGKAFRYIIYKLTDDLKDIVVDKTGDRDSSYENFTQEMFDAESRRECRYAVYDAEYQSKEKHEKQKLVFIFWAPENALVKQKMVYSASKDALKTKLGRGVTIIVQANDHGDLTWENILEKCMANERD